MAPPSWATAEQLTFLCGYMPIFADYTEKEKQAKFWPQLNENWFKRWPELDALIKDGQLPPEADPSDPDTPGDHNGESPRYQMTNEERELYGAAIQTRKQVSVPSLKEYITHQRVFPLETTKLDSQQQPEGSWSFKAHPNACSYVKVRPS